MEQLLVIMRAWSTVLLVTKAEAVSRDRWDDLKRLTGGTS